jgi:hypothetical protein
MFMRTRWCWMACTYATPAALSCISKALPAPSIEEVRDVARRTAERVEALLERTSRFSDVELTADQPVLESCYQAAATGRELLGRAPGSPRCA